MTSTPRGMRRHVGIFGKTNIGKSTLFNMITGQDVAIVSPVEGTTTDPILKNIEFLPFGPITLIDTAGYDDLTELGKKRMEKTLQQSRKSDLSLVVIQANEYKEHSPAKEKFIHGEKLHVFTKCDLADEHTLSEIKRNYPAGVLVSIDDETSIAELKAEMVKRLTLMGNYTDESLMSKLLPPGSNVVMVIPIDSAAPKGRLILPQVNLIRECLDHGIIVHLAKDTELVQCMEQAPKVDMVITDSQAFGFVSSVISEDIPLTSFSMLLSFSKGNFLQQMEGINHIRDLNDDDKVLMLESCTHNHGYEDIGRVKIPGMLRKVTGKRLQCDVYAGNDVPSNLSEYNLIVHCGACMINKTEMSNRLSEMNDLGIPVTNYGIILAYFTGILDRCAAVFEKEMV